MFRPDNLLAPRGPVFAEPWHAQVLAMAEALVLSGRITAADWAEALGGALARAEGAGAEDTEAAYYGAALEALEALTVATTVLTPDDLRRRKEAWADAYRATPHGQPVKLGVVD